ncbi:Putative glycoside hydrolase family 47, six-hairpin glycosidase-like superfamily [Septoria linicola]|uniref:alpha-1,2-Mannosidase n=1 Tax=Septoria linicola TaxID=215465 RepID=A0A9Q9EFJ3_9PEZI|nr:Putative glycoside hydrolase family 47, six-hairpin glycosidase-like superfamily [Septoria linicola]
MFARVPLVLLFASSTLAVDLDYAAPYSAAAYQGYAPQGQAPTPVAPNEYGKKPTQTITRTVYNNPAATKAAPIPSLPAGGNRTSHIGSCKNVQSPNARGDQQKAEAIKEAFLHGWNAYVKYANGYDELRPLTLNGTNNRYGWGLTIVDSIDTAIIMGLTDIVNDMLDFTAQVNFTTTEFLDAGEGVQLFETNIRYVGGLLGAYDLLQSGQFGSYDQQKVDALLSQAIILADKVAYGFNTPTGIPAVFVNFTSNEPIVGTYKDDRTNTTFNSTNSASIGTFILEWGRLSDLTGNSTYRELVERANKYLVEPSPAPALKNLIGTQFDVDTGEMLTKNGGWQAGVDSFLEYLIKYYQYAPSEVAEEYKDFWVTATRTTIDNLAIIPRGFDQGEILTFVSRLSSNGTVENLADDFSCFAGGNWLLGGALLDDDDISQLGVNWAKGCYHLYNTTTTGLGPLAWAWFDKDGNTFDRESQNDAAALRSAAARGYFIPAGVENWFSRPEPLESVFYAYRITGDHRWADANWNIFRAINETARTAQAFAAVNNVDMQYGGAMSDNLDSFFFAEVLKYLYLTFTDPSVVDLSAWVFNTEAHPLQAQCAIDQAAAHGAQKTSGGHNPGAHERRHI